MNRSCETDTANTGCGESTALLNCGFSFSFFFHKERASSACSFHAAAAPSYKEKDRDLIAWYLREIKKYPIEVKLETEVKDVSTLDADEIIIATGAVPKKLPVDGAEYAVEATEFLLGEKEVGENVVIIGGGLTGCEIAYDLYLHGKKPIIVEMKNDLIAVKGVCLANSSYLRDYFSAYHVPVHLETSVCEIKENSVIVEDKKANLRRFLATARFFR